MRNSFITTLGIFAVLIIVNIFIYISYYEKGATDVDILSMEKRPAQNLIVVTYGQGEVFEKSGLEIEKTLHAINKNIKVVRWTLADIKREYSQLNDLWDFMPTHLAHNRPSCCAQKSAMFDYALKVSNPGDWIIWIDSSKYHTQGVNANVTQFIQVLEKNQMEVFPGTPLCRLTNVDLGHTAKAQYQYMDLDYPAAWYAPHYQTPMFGIKNTPLGRKIIAEFLKFSIKKEVICASHTNDQAIFSLLTKKYELPAFYYCNKETGYYQGTDLGIHELKDFNMVMKRTIGEPDIPVLNPTEIVKSWTRAGWLPIPQPNY